MRIARAGAALAAAVTLAVATQPAEAQQQRAPYRQPCYGIWTSYERTNQITHYQYQFHGSMLCGYHDQTYLPSDMWMNVRPEQCRGGLAEGMVEVRTAGRDFWQGYDLDWAGAGGVFLPSNPLGSGPAVITTYDDLPGDVCPTGLSVQSAFVYNTLDGTNLGGD